MGVGLSLNTVTNLPDCSIRYTNPDLNYAALIQVLIQNPQIVLI